MLKVTQTVTVILNKTSTVRAINVDLKTGIQDVIVISSRFPYLLFSGKINKSSSCLVGK